MHFVTRNRAPFHLVPPHSGASSLLLSWDNNGGSWRRIDCLGCLRGREPVCPGTVSLSRTAMAVSQSSKDGKALESGSSGAGRGGGGRPERAEAR